MNQSNKPWYIAFLHFLVRVLLWGILGFVIAFPLVLIWFVIGGALIEIFPKFAPYITVGFVAFVGSFFMISGMASAHKENTGKEIVKSALIVAFILTSLTLIIFSIGATSEKVLIEISILKITVGTAIGLGFGVLLGVIEAIRPKKEDDNQSLGCVFIFLVFIFGIVGYNVTETFAQTSHESLTLDPLLNNSIGFAVLGGFIWGLFKAYRTGS